MKRVFVIGLFLAPIFGYAPAHAEKWVSASCSTMIESRTRKEAEASNEMEADDNVSAFLDYQAAVEYRANCVDETDGKAKLWNELYEASDYFGMSACALGTETWKDNSDTYRQRAHDIANDILNENPPADLRALAQHLWEDTKARDDSGS